MDAPITSSVPPPRGSLHVSPVEAPKLLLRCPHGPRVASDKRASCCRLPSSPSGTLRMRAHSISSSWATLSLICLCTKWRASVLGKGWQSTSNPCCLGSWLQPGMKLYSKIRQIYLLKEPFPSSSGFLLNVPNFETTPSSHLHLTSSIRDLRRKLFFAAESSLVPHSDDAIPQQAQKCSSRVRKGANTSLRLLL